MSQLQGPTLAFAGGVSEGWTTPFPHAVGTRARDSNGNEYVFCEFEGPLAPETLVTISSAFVAQALTTTSRGLIGATPDYAKLGQDANTPTMHSSYQWTSAMAGWIQVYGRAVIGIGGGDSSPSDAANGPTTVRTSDVVRFRVPSTVTTPLGTAIMACTAYHTGSSGEGYIHGLWIATDVTVGSVSAFVGTTGATTEPTNTPSFHAVGRMAVWLNYPYIEIGGAPSSL